MSSSRVCSRARPIASLVISWNTIRFTGTLGAEQLQQVPADALALAVLVRGQEQLLGALEGVLEFLHHLLLVLRNHVEGFEVVGGVDTEVGHFSPLWAAGISLALLGRSRTCPMEASTRYSLGRKPRIVRALVGLSTMTRVWATGTGRTVPLFIASGSPVCPLTFRIGTLTPGNTATVRCTGFRLLRPQPRCFCPVSSSPLRWRQQPPLGDESAQRGAQPGAARRCDRSRGGGADRPGGLPAGGPGRREGREPLGASLLLRGLGTALGLLALQWNGPQDAAFLGSFLADNLAIAFRAVVAASTLLSLLLSWRYVEQSGTPVGEYAAILLAATWGRCSCAAPPIW